MNRADQSPAPAPRPPAERLAAVSERLIAPGERYDAAPLYPVDSLKLPEPDRARISGLGRGASAIRRPCRRHGRDVAVASSGGPPGPPQRDLILVHWTGETDYPQSGDDAVEGLRRHLGEAVSVVVGERRERYRLDRWRRT